MAVRIIQIHFAMCFVNCNLINEKSAYSPCSLGSHLKNCCFEFFEEIQCCVQLMDGASVLHSCVMGSLMYNNNNNNSEF